MAASSQKVKIIRGFKVPQKEGKYYRMLCLTGKNKGISYFLQGRRIVLGRSEKADIQVADTKSSREHAELTLLKNEYIITDLGSQNGVVVNDLKIAQHQLNNGDKVIIGQTVYKYDLIENKKSNLALIKSEDGDDDFGDPHDVEIREGEYDPYSSEESEEEELSDEEQAQKNKRILIIVVIGILAYMMIGGDEPKEKKGLSGKRKTPSVRDAFAEKLIAKNREEDKEQMKKLETILKRGLREYREENYFRAIHEFNLALILSPDNSRAQFYLSKSQQRLRETVDQLSEKGQREIEANKYLEAKVSYCSILRLYRDYPEDEAYVSALEKIAIIEEELGYVKGELKCFTDR